MHMAFLEPVIGGRGPWTSAYLADARPGPGAAAQQQLVARHACEQLARQGADDADCAAAYRELSELGTGRAGRAAFITGGTVAASLPLAEAPVIPETAWGTVPHLAPLMELAGERSVCLVAYTDRQGADFELRTAEGEESAGTVTGLDWPLHRTATADWSEQHFQEAVENTWEQNAIDTAAALAEVAAEHRPDLVLLVGGTRQRRAVHDRLPSWLTPVVAETRHGGRAPGAETALLDREITRLLAERRQLRQAETLDRFRAGLRAGHTGRAEPGRPIAVEGVPAVVEAARERRVDTLLITPGGPDTHREVWAGPEPDQLAVRRSDAKYYLGAREAAAVRADDALLRAVAAGGGEVVPVSDEDFPDSARPAGGLGALLRWTHESAARGGGIPPGSGEQPPG
jgi:hypothetical protein